MTAPENERIVVLLVGPPGAGKTTTARQSGLRVYDRDDPEWTSNTQFSVALRAIAHDPKARAVVIRSGATSTARAKTRKQIGATHTYLLTAPRDELIRRITRRNRADARFSKAGVNTWFTDHDLDDGVQQFPGWNHIPQQSPARLTPNRTGTSAAGSGDGQYPPSGGGYSRQPEHSHCNTSAGATAGNHTRTGQPPPSRQW